MFPNSDGQYSAVTFKYHASCLLSFLGSLCDDFLQSFESVNGYFLHWFSWLHLYSNHLEHDTGVGYSSNFEFLMVVSFAVVYVVCLFVYFVLLGSDILLLFIFYFTYATWNFFFCPSLSFFFKFCIHEVDNWLTN